MMIKWLNNAPLSEANDSAFMTSLWRHQMQYTVSSHRL